MLKNTKEPALVRLQSSALDERDGEIIAHGWLDVEALNNLHVGDYQREVLQGRSGGYKSPLRKALEEGERLPDVMLGMRGEKYTSRGNAMLLEDEVYIIDGLQRISAIKKFAMDNPDAIADLRIGAEVRFNTTRDSETALFTAMNVNRRSMAPSVILRNERNNSVGVATLYGLSMSDKNFALYGKVCWDQQMHRGELVTATTFAKAAITLHRHAAAGGRHLSSGASGIAKTLDNMAAATGLQHLRANLVTMYEVMDEVWGIRGIKYKDRCTHTRNNFLFCLAGMLSDHEDFWDGKKLAVDAAQKTKIKSFPIDDPTIIRLAGAGAGASLLLYRYLVDHMNKGKSQTRYLTTRRIDQFYRRTPRSEPKPEAKTDEVSKG